MFLEKNECIFVRIMNTYLISIGSNENRDDNMENCRQILIRLFPDIVFSEVIECEPVGDGYRNSFLNQLAVFESVNTSDQLHRIFKNIEHTLGRTSDDKLIGIVKIDIDLLVVNNKILKFEDFERSYVKILLERFVSFKI